MNNKNTKSMPLWAKLTAVAVCCAVAIVGIKMSAADNSIPEAGGINTMVATESVTSADDKIYFGAEVGTDNDNVITEKPADDVFIPYPDAENATRNNEYYAGCYLNEKQELVVLLTVDTPENRKIVCADLDIAPDNVIFKEAKYSKAYLDSLHEKVTEVMLDRKYETIVASGVMEMDNYLEVMLTEEDAEAIAFLEGLDNTGAINIVYGAVSTTDTLVAPK